MHMTFYIVLRAGTNLLDQPPGKVWLLINISITINMAAIKHVVTYALLRFRQIKNSIRIPVEVLTWLYGCLAVFL